MKKQRIMISLGHRIASFLAVLAIATNLHAASLNSSKESAGRLSLQAQAKEEAPQDEIRIVLFHEKQGDDPASLTAILKQKVDQALRIAKTKNKVFVQTGLFKVYPLTDRDGRIKGWRGRAELLLESHEFATAARLAGQLSPLMQVSDVRFSLSTEALHQVEDRLSDQAITAFNAQAQRATAAFGYKSYVVLEASLHKNGLNVPQPVNVMMTSSIRGDDQLDIPVAAGKTTVTVSVSGSIRMK